ncbi:dihydroorotase [Maribacter vaceletii]|uniref:Dihydroorotase n=1 Tax=Maribacter vaceletii TaxID=1206816 RepID=A0A495E8N3_9FLAO|nr:dihydroorotase [Maribacter vaceletii]RKR13305.1 dihydroorotase [Maribacter vaceletii]
MNILLKSAIIVDSSNKALHLKKRDILIKDGSIISIASKIDTPANTKEIKLKNLHVSIGWFDSSVSFGEPGYEERETIANGIATAAKSGFTDLVLNPSSTPVPDTSSDIVFLKNAAQNKGVNLYPLGCLTNDAKGESLAELFDMKNAGAVGFYDAKHPISNPNLLKIALQYTESFEGLVYSYPLDKKIAGKGIVNEGTVSTKLGLKGIPALAEELQIARDLFILEYAGGKLHIPTISTANGVKLIADAKKKGLNVSCSVAIHNLIFDDTVLHDFDSNYKVMPPLRTNKDCKALVKGVKDGIIDFVTSDHTPINIENKKVEFDNADYGTTGLESAFGSLNLLFGLEKTIELLTKGRERYGLETLKFKEGEKAFITLFNPEETFIFKREESVSTSKNSAFIGKELKGKAYGIIANNEVLF